MTSRIKNWNADSADGTAITVNTASAVTLIANTPEKLDCVDVLIDNPGPRDVFVKMGGSGVVATVNSFRVPSTTQRVLRKGPTNTHLATIAVGGTQAITVHLGEGAV